MWNAALGLVVGAALGVGLGILILRIRKRVFTWPAIVTTGAFALVIVFAALALAWWRNEWDLEAAGMIGDSVAPITGGLSLLAVAAALWTVHVQESEIATQQVAMQRDSEDRRQAKLRDAYTPFLAALDTYLREVEHHIALLNGRVRTEWDNSLKRVREAHADSIRADFGVQLVDTNGERRKLRESAQDEIVMRPAAVNDGERLLFADVINLYVLHARQRMRQLVEHLHGELGVPIVRNAAELKLEELALAAARADADEVRNLIAGDPDDAALREGRVRAAVKEREERRASEKREP